MATPGNTFPTEAALSAQDVTLWNDGSMAQTDGPDDPRIWQLQKLSVLSVGPDVLTANTGGPTGRWLAMRAALAASYVDVDIPFPDGDTSARVVVPATWLTAGTQLVWSIQEATATKNPEEAIAEGFQCGFVDLVAGVSFTIIGQTVGPSNGTFRVRVTGVRL